MIDPKILLQIKNISPKCIIIIDNSWLSPILYNPYKYYADIVIESLTKYMSGGYIIMGCATGSKKQIKNIKYHATISGQHISPYDCWSISQSIENIKIKNELYIHND